MHPHKLLPLLLCADSLQTRPQRSSAIWMSVWECVCELFSVQGRTVRCQRIRTQDSHGPARSSLARLFHLRISVVYRPLAHALRVHHLRVSDFFSRQCGISDAHLNATDLGRAIINKADLQWSIASVVVCRGARSRYRWGVWVCVTGTRVSSSPLCYPCWWSM